MEYLGLYSKLKAEVHLGCKVTGPKEEEEEEEGGGGEEEWSYWSFKSFTCCTYNH
jgi:hypothetical protein